MLPTSGYFQDVVCPFYKSGLCERPHCHFRHAKTGNAGKVQSQNVSLEDNDQNAKPDLFSILQRTESNLQPVFGKPPYIHGSVAKPSGILKVPVAKQEKIPEYKPTPIYQLKHLNPDVNLPTDTPYEGPGSRKRKKFEEYVPEEVKYSRKRVSFNLPEDDTSEDVITIESSEDELDADCSAKFSDDDFNDEEEIQICPAPETNVETTSVDVDVEQETQKDQISKFSLVDKILVDVSRNEELIRNFNKPVRIAQTKGISKTTDVRLCESESRTKTVQESSSLDKSHASNSNTSIVKLPANGVTNKYDTNEGSDGAGLEDQIGTEETCKDGNIHIEEQKSQDVKQEEKKVNIVRIKTSHKVESSKTKLPHDEKGKSSREIKVRKDVKGINDESRKSSREEKSKSTKEEKTKSSKEDQKKSNRDEKSKSSKDDKSSNSKGDKIRRDDKGKSTKDDRSSTKEKIKSSREDAAKTCKDGMLKDSKIANKTGIGKSASKDVTSKSSKEPMGKSEKISPKDHSKYSKDPAVKPKHDKPRSDMEKSKSSSSNKHSSSSHKSTHSSKSKHESASTQNKSSSSSQSSRHNDKSLLKKKEPKKIQDEKISSSSKSELNSESLLRSAGSNQTYLLDKGSIDGEDAHSDLDDVELQSSGSEMDSDTYEECLRIFNEENGLNTESSKSSDVPSTAKDSDEHTFAFPGKKRMAHQAEFKRNLKSPRLTEKPRLSPAQIMHNRYLQLQKMYAKQNEQQDSNLFVNSINKTGADGPKKRIAAVPNSSLIAAVSMKNKMMSSSSSSGNSSGPLTTSPTIVTTVKGERRVAHVPTAARSPRPLIPASYGSKVPTNIRQRYLNNFIDECLKFCITEDQAYELALEEEKKAYDRSTNKTIYLNVAANTLNRLRHRAREGPPAELPDDFIVHPTVSSTTSPAEPSSLSNKTLSHEMMLAGPKGQKCSYSIERRKTAPEPVPKGVLLYSYLSDYILNEEQLVQNGFPLPHPSDLGRAVMSSCYANKHQVSSDPLRRICSRCSKTYDVDEDGEYVKPEECEYHWGRIFKKRLSGSIESRYTCCQGDPESDGCCVGLGHVHEGSDSDLSRGFVKTFPKTPPPDNYYGIYALDCEMSYTTAGTELTRVTVIGPDMNPVFETYVKPEHKVLDYNTRFSGITEEDLVGITTSIRDVQAILLCMFNDKTILIGHSLESDFKALKLIHKTVVDTSVVFPHKSGHPFKRALRSLIAEKCHKIIQNNIAGHDSHEDAAACMELMMWKIKEDIKCPSR